MFATMGSRQLIVFGFMLVCVRLTHARFLSLSVPTYWGVDVQKPADVEAKPEVESERGHSREFVQQAARLQSKQFQQAGEPLSWRFPDDPVDRVNKHPYEFKPQQPMVPTNRVALRCGESRIQVEVSQDLQGLGKLIKPEEITLGGCSATEVDKLSHVLIFESELHGCGSTLVMTENSFIYAFTLIYNPKVFNKTNIIRRQSALIGVECHYPR
ncbi:hypothetical protein PAMP_019077 [Pampus punctatissimus]